MLKNKRIPLCFSGIRGGMAVIRLGFRGYFLKCNVYGGCGDFVLHAWVNIWKDLTEYSVGFAIYSEGCTLFPIVVFEDVFKFCFFMDKYADVAIIVFYTSICVD